MDDAGKGLEETEEWGEACKPHVIIKKRCKPGRHVYVKGLCIFCNFVEGTELGLEETTDLDEAMKKLEEEKKGRFR